MGKVVIVEKKPEYNMTAKVIEDEIIGFLGINSLKGIRVLNAYSLSDVNDDEYKKIVDVLSDDNIDIVYDKLPNFSEDEKVFEVFSKPGQYSKREDMAKDFINVVSGFEDVKVKYSEIMVLRGISEQELDKIKSYYINPVDSEEGDFSFEIDEISSSSMDVDVVENFTDMNETELLKLKEKFAMDLDDLKFIQEHFKSEGRDPNMDELNILDTYWSDHCRHTTFLTEITDIEVEDGEFTEIYNNALDEYKKSRENINGNNKVISLMDLATVNMKEITKAGLLEDKEKTDEVNACSVEVKIDVDGKDENYLLMFKNETHNHPTEVEPYGGANTCIGGGIRDPLSARSFVYQAMRITGASNPLKNFEETRKNKLSQRYICKKAMNGYSDYGNDIGLAGGYVKEFYHPGFEAKRMELGALVSIAPKENVVRKTPETGDLILLLGAATGRDGLGAAVGSSNVQTQKSLKTAGAQVQKGNAFAERGIIRLFKRKEATTIIKKCNDFGAGGVAVAVGELAESLDINLDKVRLKYDGLNGGEIALSESQERMAVVISSKDLDEFVKYCNEEDVRADVIAKVTDTNRMIMNFRGKKIIDIDRNFLNTNGARKKAEAKLLNPKSENYLNSTEYIGGHEERLEKIFSDIRNASQKSLGKNFDNTCGGFSVLLQMGGKTQNTYQLGMVGKIPVPCGKTKKCSVMTFGYDPDLALWSEFHGGYYAVVNSVIKAVALGCDYKKIRLSFQEYFERLDNNSEKWGKPLKALLGAFTVMKSLNIPSIGGKDSMSGSFEEIDVPPSLISFAVGLSNTDKVVSREFKTCKNNLILIETPMNDKNLLNLEQLKLNLERISKLIEDKKIESISDVDSFGIVKTVCDMSFGNEMGLKFENFDERFLYGKNPGGILIEISDENLSSLDFKYKLIGKITDKFNLEFKDCVVNLSDILNKSNEVFKDIYPEIKVENEILDYKYVSGNKFKRSSKIEKPKVLIPIFQGTTGESDFERSFKKEGCEVETFVINMENKTSFENSLNDFCNKLKTANILGLASGRIMGDEPYGSGTLIEEIFKRDAVKREINSLINEREGLILGVGGGFAGLVKSGLIEFDEVKKAENITLASNYKNIYISSMADFKVVSNNSCWLNDEIVEGVFTAPLSTGYGKLMFKDIEKLKANGQVAVLYDEKNETDSYGGVVALTSPSGKVFGCLPSIDRMDDNLYKNVTVKGLSKIIKSGVEYFKN